MSKSAGWRISLSALVILGLVGFFQNCSGFTSNLGKNLSFPAPLTVTSQSSASTDALQVAQCNLQTVSSNYAINETGANESTLDQGQTEDSAGCLRYCQSINSTFCALQYTKLDTTRNDYFCVAFLNVVPAVSTNSAQGGILMAGSCSPMK